MEAQINISPKYSIDSIIDFIHQTRDGIIDDLLTERSVLPSLENQFRQVATSPLRLEFLKRDLRELKKSKLDLAHYSSLIKKIKESNITVAVELNPLFQQEVKSILRKYTF